MGQINCHCRSVSIEEETSFQVKSDGLIALTAQSSEPAQVSTKITLKGESRVIEVPLQEGNKLTLGTTDDCHQRIQSLNGVQFKLQVKYRSRFVYLKDCGVGMGVFMRKRKLVTPFGSAEVLLNICEKWVVLKVSPGKQISVYIYSGDKCDRISVELQQQQQINLGECSLDLRSREQSRQLSVRRSDRGEMWVLLGQQRKVRPKDVLRVGPEQLEVASISTYLECSTIIKRY